MGKFPTWILGLAVLMIALLTPGASAGDAEPTVSLRWALGALEADASAPSAIQRDTQLATGTRLKLLVEPLSPGSVYLILLDADDAIHVLYNQSSQGGSAAEPTYIPAGSQWFALDDEAGMETFFLLASADPLTGLQTRLDDYEAAEPAARKDLASGIVGEIRRLQKEHRNFSRPAERPVVIGGQTRGTEDASAAIDRLAVEVEAERFYAKTITIDH